MSQRVIVTLELPDGIASLRLPPDVERRLQTLLDRQDRGENLSPERRREAEGLVELVELLSVLRSRVRSRPPGLTG